MRAINRPATLKDQALNELRNSIMSGAFAPGQRLVERVLGEQLQVSRTVVRECIRHLESERLVNTVPNSGPVVTVLSKAEIREIYQLRALLESKAASQCAQNVNKTDSKKLLSLVDRIEEQLAAQDINKALHLTTALYRTIFNIAELEISWDMIEQLNSRINQLRMRSLDSSTRRKTGPQSLRKMVLAINEKDPAKAAAACAAHIEQAMRASLDYTKNSVIAGH